MHCPNCGNELPENASFCQKCGYSILPVTRNAHDASHASRNAAHSTAASKPSKLPIIIVIAVAVVAIVAIACFAVFSNSPKSSDSETASSATAPKTQSTQVSETASSSSDSIQDEPTEPEEELFWDVYIPESPSNTVVMGDATPFNEGYAWVLLKEYNGGAQVASQLFAIDKEGSVVYSLPKKTGTEVENRIEVFNYDKAPDKTQASGVSDFENGAAWVAEDNDGVLIDTDGNVIYAASKDAAGDGAKRYGDGTVDRIKISATRALPSDEPGIAGGKAMVEYYANDYSGSGWNVGFLDREGKWFFEPTPVYSRFGFSSGAELNRNFATFSQQQGEDRHMTLLDLVSGETSEYDSSYQGEAADIYAERYPDNALVVSDGLICRYGAYKDYDETYFRNAAGEVVIDLSKYNLHDYGGSKQPVFHDGYCLLRVENPTGDDYYTIIDTTGKELFAPKKWPAANNFNDSNASRLYGYAGDGLMLVSIGESYEDATDWDGCVSVGQFMNLDGEPVGDVYLSAYPYSCGLALVQEKDAVSGVPSWKFIDANGEDVFQRD